MLTPEWVIRWMVAAPACVVMAGLLWAVIETLVERKRGAM